MEPAVLLALVASAPSLRDFVAHELLSGVPWIFGDRVDEFDEWRAAAGNDALVDPASIYLVGSAATGYSLSPLKPELSRDDVLNTNAHPMEASRDVLAY